MTFGSLTAVVCTVAGNIVTVVAEGLCSIQANQAADALFLPAPPVTQIRSVTTTAAASAAASRD